MSLNPSSASAPCVGLSFSGKTVFGASGSASASTGPAHKAVGPDAINLLNAGRPIQPANKLLDNWFNGNSTSVNVNNRPKAVVTPFVGYSRMILSFVAM